MNETRTIQQLERDLHGSEEVLAGPALSDIRARGRSRRRQRLAAYVGAATACLVAGSALAGVVMDDEKDARDRSQVATRPTPTELSPLAKRALREIPGAVQVSAWQVVIPGPDMSHDFGNQVVASDLIEAGPVDIGATHYVGVTSYRPRAFPGWLYEGVQGIERTELADEEGYPVGSKDMGIIVDAGPMDLACMRPLPEWGGNASEDCSAAMLGEVRGAHTYAWGMGTDDFLEEGEDLELFSTEDYSSGAERTVWIGGTDGTDVASVTLVTTDGTEVEATVAAGTLVAGETMFWGTVDGALARAITRDGDGKVLERHELRPCTGGADCEVR